MHKSYIYLLLAILTILSLPVKSNKADINDTPEFIKK